MWGTLQAALVQRHCPLHFHQPLCVFLVVGLYHDHHHHHPHGLISQVTQQPPSPWQAAWMLS